MPWTVRTLLTISLILLPIYVYIGLRSTTALNLVFPGILTKARIAALLVIVWLSVWPLFLAAVYFLGTSSPFLSSETRVAWTDYFFYYPVWMGMIVALELLVPFLLADVVAALLR